MNHEQEANYIAKYAIIQEALNNASNLVIQVFGFSIAAIIALVLAALQAQNTNSLFAVLFIINFIICSSSFYISNQSKSIIDTEAYIVVFIEPKILDFSWRKLLLEKSQRNHEKNYALRPPLNIPDFAIVVYIFILALIIVLLLPSFIFNLNAYNTTLIIITFLSFLFVLNYSKYNSKKYHLKCQEYFEKRKQQQQDDNLSIQEAADILNMSSSFLVKLLEEGKIPFTKLGSEHWIRFEDLITHKKQRDSQRREGLRELTQFLQEEGFYKDEEN